MKVLGTDCTPGEIIDAMEEVLGEEGTLLMPALTYENVNAEQPIFDSAATEPCIGLLPRVFLHRPGVERSVHPTYSVCAKGKMAHRLTVGHSMDDAAVGLHSPFMLLPLYRGKLLFIGDILHSCTFMHGIETILKPPYIRQSQSQSPAFTVDGETRRYMVGDDYGWGSEFQRIEEILAYPDIRKGKLLSANGYLIDTRALFAAALLKVFLLSHTGRPLMGLEEIVSGFFIVLMFRGHEVKQKLSRIVAIRRVIPDSLPDTLSSGKPLHNPL